LSIGRRSGEGRTMCRPLPHADSRPCLRRLHAIWRISLLRFSAASPPADYQNFASTPAATPVMQWLARLCGICSRIPGILGQAANLRGALPRRR